MKTSEYKKSFRTFLLFALTIIFIFVASYKYLSNNSEMWLVLAILDLAALAGAFMVLLWSKNVENEKDPNSDFETEMISKNYALIKKFNLLSRYSNDIIILLDEDLQIVDINQKALDVYGYTREEAVKMNIKDLRAFSVKKDFNQLIKEIGDHDGLIFETLHKKKNGYVFPVDASYRMVISEGRKYYQGVLNDITEKKGNQQRIERLRSIRAVSSGVNKTIIRVKSQRVIFERSCELGVKEGLFSAVWIGLLDKEDKLSAAAYNGIEEQDVQTICDFINSETEKSDPITKCIFTGRHQIVNRPNIEETLPAFEYKSCAVFPLAALSRLKGVMVFYSETENFFDLEQIDLIDEMTSDISFSIDYLEKEKKHRKSEEEILRLSRAAEQSPVSIIMTNNEGIIEYANSKTLELTGYTKEELIGQNASVFKSGYTTQNEYQKLWDVISSGEDWSGEFLTKKKDGLLFWEHASISPIRNCIGEITGYLSIKEDITEQKNREIEKNRMFDYSLDMLSIASFDCCFRRLNPAWKNTFGWSELELKSKPFIEFIHPDDKEETLIAAEKLMSGEEVINFENRFLCKDGGYKWLSWKSLPLVQDREVFSVTRDITEQKKNNDALVEAKERAEEANRIKTNFLANMSHELRTPLVGILGYAEIIKSDFENPELSHYAERILKCGNRLKDAVNLILDLSSIESEVIEINKTDVNINDLIVEAVEPFRQEAESKNLDFTVTERFDNVTAKFDERMLYTLISNIVNNAVKYTDKGGIFIEAKIEISDGKKELIIKIEDTGIGIDKDNLSMVFEPFRQVSEGIGRGFEGTGLGLTISKKFVELMKGELTVESELNKGSIFTVALPLEEVYGIYGIDRENEKSSEYINKKLTTLVIENDPISISFLRIALKELCEIEYTCQGEEAIEMAKIRNYDVILIDINPGKGWEGMSVVREIRKLEQYKNTPIIAITAFALKEEEEIFLKNGCNHYISKPFGKQQLIDYIGKLF
jgi:PAS domain S-box-containing protein